MEANRSRRSEAAPNRVAPRRDARDGAVAEPNRSRRAGALPDPVAPRPGARYLNGV
ncbi:hypothetical protein GALLR39Z86_20280 [Glycomyces algeriensis]|uniref:Uncharacterized protein n=1 Tax=Glycomyces algeriensis TaxID=256037 RepID=A0A9W6LG18_9ACTN|nr:hypothetical protein GALLR39Z86_20280 [Glycomyces algeriensis]